MQSTRLPGKVLEEINSQTIIEIILKRLSQSKLIDRIVVATSTNAENDILEKEVLRHGYECFRGDEENVMHRFYDCADKYKAKNIVRITGDCPFIDYEIVDECVNKFLKADVDYLSNIQPPSFPDGLDVEVFKFSAFEKTCRMKTTPSEREHVTTLLRSMNIFSRFNLEAKHDYSSLRWTLDEKEDLRVVTNVLNFFKPNIFFSWKNVLDLYKKNQALFKDNQNIINNEGSKMNKGQKLYKRAKKIIPGGNMLLSKRPEMFLPNLWPSYFSKAKGCKVWDLENNSFQDFSLMGVGTNTLGYGNEEIDNAVIDSIKLGNMSTLNCPEEVYLAEELVSMHPWADMVRFARSGGEINSVAVRIARAASGKDKILICGYHGWHDWYLSSNLEDKKNLNSHLLKGLKPLGVPKGLTGSSIPFQYNNFHELEQLIKKHRNDIAAIKMEVVRNKEPEDDFLKKVRDICSLNNIILIFDECTSGFRECYGGIHKKYEVEPDIAIFGKALGNGYAITACIGKAKYMNACQDTFISSTFWTERIGYVAALKTLEVMKRLNSWSLITTAGNKIRKGWIDIFSKNDLDAEVSGISALSSFAFSSKDNLKYKTFITQEMLKRGYLATNSVYSCIDHSDKKIQNYLKNFEEVITEIKQFDSGAKSIDNYLDSEICHSGFERLN